MHQAQSPYCVTGPPLSGLPIGRSPTLAITQNEPAVAPRSAATAIGAKVIPAAVALPPGVCREPAMPYPNTCARGSEANGGGGERSGRARPDPSRQHDASLRLAQRVCAAAGACSRPDSLKHVARAAAARRGLPRKIDTSFRDKSKIDPRANLQQCLASLVAGARSCWLYYAALCGSALLKSATSRSGNAALKFCAKILKDASHSLGLGESCIAREAARSERALEVAGAPARSAAFGRVKEHIGCSCEPRAREGEEVWNTLKNRMSMRRTTGRGGSYFQVVEISPARSINREVKNKAMSPRVKFPCALRAP
jgi:hypothetical protein